MMDQALCRRWVADLRAHPELQGQGKLQKDGKFCCLGRLCVVAGVEWEEDNNSKGAMLPVGSGCLNAPVDWLEREFGLPRWAGDALWKMNDGIYKGVRSTFPQIADWIERNLFSAEEASK